MSAPVFRTKQLALLQSLLKKSDSLLWESAGEGDDFFWTTMGSYRVTVAMDVESSVVSITDSCGVSLDVFRPSDLSDLDPTAQEKGLDLLAIARRKAMGADKALNDILAFLQEHPYR